MAKKQVTFDCISPGPFIYIKEEYVKLAEPFFYKDREVNVVKISDGIPDFFAPKFYVIVDEEQVMSTPPQRRNHHG